MKKILFLGLALSIIACNSNKKTTNGDAGNTTNSSEMPSEYNPNGMNQLMPDSENEGEKILLGNANRSGLEKAPFGEWFADGLKSFEPDMVVVNKLKPLLKDIEIKAFMGTWCSDSQREIPQLYKILDVADYNYDKFKLITVDHDKTTPQSLEEGLDIDYVPTIILYRNGKEIGRFVEYAKETLEKDLYTIASDADYKHAYAE